MAEAKKRIPKRRFKEFRNGGDWEERKLGELGSIITGSTPSTQVHGYYSDNGIPWVTPTDISNNITFRTAKHLTTEGQKVARVVPQNSILVTSIASIGKNTMLGTAGSFNQQINGLVPNEKENNPYFLFTESTLWSEKMKRTAASGTMQIVNKTEFSEINTCIPTLEEQAKIGDFFKTLDTLITLHQRKLDKLKSTKKAYLSEMFPAEGESKPKRRFKGFSGDWEEMKLGELANIVRGASPRPIKDPKWFDDKSDVGWLRISDVTEQDGRIRFLEQKISKAGQEKTRVLFEPHLLLSIAATVGKPVINYVDTGVHDGFLIFINPKFNQEFMFQWFEMFRPKWQQFGQPGSQVNLNSDLVKNTPILLPKEDEQEKLGEHFKTLDNLITLHQQKLDKLKHLKKAYLNEMFI